MSEPREFSADLPRLLDALLEGTLTEPDRVNLSHALLADPAARELYCRYIALHTLLQSEHAAPLELPTESDQYGPAPLIPTSQPPTVPPPTLPALSKVEGSPRPIVPSSHRPIVPPSHRPTVPPSRRPTAPSPKLGFLARVSRGVPGGEATVGSLVVLVVVAAFWSLSQAIMYPNLGGQDLASSTDSPTRPLAHSPARTQPVATILGSEDAQWSPRREAGLPPAIRQGETLQIASGVVEIQLNRGTSLHIQGPAEWSVLDDNRVRLSTGKLVARVPAGAIGFAVETPTTTIVDLGTEFGVEVLPDGSSGLEVFEGQVRIDSPAGSKQPTIHSQIIHAGESRRIDAQGIQSIAFQPEHFDSMRFAKQTEPAPKKTGNDVAIGTTEDKQSSWNLPSFWADGKAPHPHGHYHVGGQTRRRVYTSGDGKPEPFQGGVLSLHTEGELVIRHVGTAQVRDLRLDGGRIFVSAKLRREPEVVLDGKLTLLQPAIIRLNRCRLKINASLIGPADLHVIGPSQLTLQADSRKFHGHWRVEDATLVAATFGSLGSGNIALAGTSVLDPQYRLNSPDAALTLEGGSSLVLNWPITLGSVWVAGNALPAGTYTPEQLQTLHPGFFTGTAGSLTVLSSDSPILSPE